MTKPNIFPLRPNLALDDAQQLFLEVMRYCGKRLTPEQVRGLCDIYNNFKPKAARDAATPPQDRKDQPMPKDMSQETNIRAAMNFLEEKLSDEDLAELTRIMGEGSGVDGGDQPVTMAALAELHQARKETAPVLGGGATDMALDSAAKVYGEALRVVGRDTYGVRDAKSLRAIFRTARKYQTGQPLVAMDSKTVAALHERYPHAARIGGV